MNFRVEAKDGRARAGIIETAHGNVDTPAFMPIGTQGSVKAIEHRELKELGAQIILANTYHLYLRPGDDVIGEAGGLHRFVNWDRPMLTDSGGYQVYSLNQLRKIEEEGVMFMSHLDGSKHFFTPESVIGIQRKLGSDVMMVLDECTPYPCTLEYAETSNALTVRWAERCKTEFERNPGLYGFTQALFAIVQGSVYPAVREQSAKFLVEMDFDGYALGGLAVGEPAETMYKMTAFCEPFLPENKPRYLMGVGTPENLLESIDRGIDMFDCVLPTRNGRNAMLFTSAGSLNITNAAYTKDYAPVDSECTCYTCTTFSRAYLRHLFHAKEILALQLATIHNLAFYLRLMKESRKAIVGRRFREFKQSVFENLQTEVPTS